MRQPCIRVYYTGGPVDHGQEWCLIGPYPSTEVRDREILRLASIAGGTVPSPWTFEPEHADRDDADLWAPAHSVTKATEGLTERDELVVDPDRLLRLFVSPLDSSHGWYTVLRDGEFVDVRSVPDTAPLFTLDDQVVATDGATTTVGGLVDLAFWFNLEPGQTETHDALRLHLLSAHCNLAAPLITDQEALQQHHDEHHGPGGIRNHDPASVDWDMTKCQNLFVDAQQERQAVGDYDWDEDDDAAGAAFSAHVERINNPGQARTKPWTKAPKTYEEVTRYAVSILPPDDPWRRHNEIHVERYRRTGDEWVVQYGAALADRAGTWHHVDPAGQHIFPLDEALSLARRLAPDVSITGEHTALDVLNMPREGRR